MKATLDFTNKMIQLEGSPTLQDIHVFQRTLIDWREWRVEGTEKEEVFVNNLFDGPDVVFADWAGYGTLPIPKPRGAKAA